jgi:hypothetical protein
MSVDVQPSPAASQQPQHARELQARLYREIGISAVAAALQLPEPPVDVQVEQHRDNQPMLRKDIAA